MKPIRCALRRGILPILLSALLLSFAAAATPPAPPWDAYANDGGQVDDTAFAEVIRWCSDPRSRTAVTFGSQQVAASTIVANARSLVDKYPYVYGGESPEEGGFDCTGLVWYVYNRMSGLNISLSEAGRSKAALANAGEQIYDHDAFLPGDVIQFTYAHVAIYVGDGRVVHARTTGTMIQETDLNYNNVEYAVRYPGITQNAVVASGTCGKSLTWALREDGSLTVSGSGDMTNFADQTSIPWYACRDSITSVVLEDGVTSIGSYAFYGLTALDSVSAPGISSVGPAAFYNCSALAALSLSDSTESIGSWAFYGCQSLTALSLPSGLISIGNSAFSRCTGLVSVTFPDRLTAVGDGAFENCSSLQRIEIPDSVTLIGDSAFLGCTALERAALGSGVERIDDYAFFSCASLVSVTIPAATAVIGDWAFADCTALEQVTYTGLRAQWDEILMGTRNEALLQATLTCTGIPYSPTVTLSIDPEFDMPTLTWNAIPYADRYEIWRKEENGSFTLLLETEDTSFRDMTATAGSIFFYRVRAISGTAHSKYSDITVFFVMPRFSAASPP